MTFFEPFIARTRSIGRAWTAFDSTCCVVRPLAHESPPFLKQVAQSIGGIDLVWNFLVDGFTMVRDTNGKGVKKLVDRGDLSGPWTNPSGAFLSQTSGHADTRPVAARNPLLSGVMDSDVELLDIAHQVYGREAILAAVWRDLKQGDGQIKHKGGSGVATEYYPWYSSYSLSHYTAGRRNQNVAPAPASLSTPISPPKYFTISTQIGRPIPVPRGLFVNIFPTC